MNGFLEMVTQTQIEDLVKEMDTDYDQEIDRDRGETVMDLFKDVLVAFRLDDTAHPAEHAVEEIVRAVATMYMMLQLGSPAVVSLMAKDLIVAAVEFNKNVQPVIMKLHKEIVEE